MPIIRTYSSNPGDDVLVGSGPAINIIENLVQAIRFSSGRTVVLAVGSVVNDHGEPEIPIQLTNGWGELMTTFGGFKAWLGDGLGAAEAGAASGYEGNLAARGYQLDAPVCVLQPVDMSLRDKAYSDAAAIELEMTLNRSAGTYGSYTLPAGTRMKPAAGTYYIATLEDVYWDGTAVTNQTVRCRQATSASVAPVQLSTVDTFVDTPADTNVTVVSGPATAPIVINEAEMILRYEGAINHILDNAVGKSAAIVFSDTDILDVADHLAAHCVTASGAGFFRICVVSPPVGTTAAVAQGAATDGIGRPTLDRSRCVYVHPAITRAFQVDSGNLVAPRYLATFPAAAVAACAISQWKPEENPANPHALLRKYGISGQEALAVAVVAADHYNAAIMMPDFEQAPNGSLEATFFAGILAYTGSPVGTTLPLEIADRRMSDYVYLGCIQAAKPGHKKLANARNQQSVIDSVIGFLQNLVDAERVDSFAVTGSWDGTLQMLTVDVACRLLGNMNVITFPVTVGTSVVIE
ncbi:MAG: hypothetical protein ABIL09_11090 [Gemmatimonadota bacterium]